MKGSIRAALATAVALTLLSAPATAAAELRLDPGDVTLQVLDSAGKAETRAGAHPDRLRIVIDFSDDGTIEEPKDLLVSLPRGLAGETKDFPLCPGEIFGAIQFQSCGPESAAGTVALGDGGFPEPLFALAPPPDQAAMFGAGTLVKVLSLVETRADDNGIAIRIRDLFQHPLIDTRRFEIELWGVPADHQEVPGAPRMPILSLGTRCDIGAPAVTVSAETWQRPGRRIFGSADTGRAPTGCATLPFDPSLGFTLGDDPRADSPTGADVQVALPADRDPDGRASSELRSMSVALPQGMSISLGGAEGLVACTDAQLDIDAKGDPACPSASAVGTVEALTPATSQPMKGTIYLGASKGADRFRLFITASGPGTEIKEVGVLQPDSRTGRLTTRLDDLPEIPLEELKLSFDNGPGALLATPTECGTATTTATLTPYSATTPIARSAATQIGGCPATVPFSPGFRAGAATAAAGAPTSFVAQITRKDGEGMPDRIAIEMPPGLAGALGSLEACPEAAARAASCPARSKIGTATTELGPGPTVARLQGDLFLTGPYKNAPFGVEIVLPAKIGPYDLGSMAIRGTVSLDRESGQVSVATDPLPRELEGIAVRLRSLGLRIDRPGFLRNPTSCSASTVDADIRSTEAARSKPSSPFRVSGCVGLALKPSFALRLTDKSEQHERGRPGLTIAGKIPATGANMRAADIHLPAMLKLDSSRLAAICSRADALRGRCQKAAILGKASGRSPVLASPLSGNVYAVAPEGGGSPDVWAALSGQGIEILLKGETVVRKGRVEAKLTELPDFPLSSFALELDGGEDGIFLLRRSPCAKRLRVPIEVEGQNEATRYLAPRLGVSCGRR